MLVCIIDEVENLLPVSTLINILTGKFADMEIVSFSIIAAILEYFSGMVSGTISLYSTYLLSTVNPPEPQCAPDNMNNYNGRHGA